MQDVTQTHAELTEELLLTHVPVLVPARHQQFRILSVQIVMQTYAELTEELLLTHVPERAQEGFLEHRTP